MRLESWKCGSAIAVCVMAIAIGQVAAPVTGSARVIQEQDQPNPQQTAPPDATPATQPTPKPTQETRRPPLPPGANVRVDITIADQAGTDAPVKKTLSVIAEDRHGGSVRSKVTVVVPGPPVQGPVATGPRYEELPLNIDVKTEVMNNGLIRTQLILNYETFSASRETGAAVRSVVTGNQTVMLENGKPLIVSQSADAATDRKVTLELKATILR